MLIFFHRPFPNLFRPYRKSIFSSGVHRPVRWMGPIDDDGGVRGFDEIEAFPSSAGGASGGDRISCCIASFLMCAALSSIGVSMFGICMVWYVWKRRRRSCFWSILLSWNGNRSGIFSHPNPPIRYLLSTHAVRSNFRLHSDYALGLSFDYHPYLRPKINKWQNADVSTSCMLESTVQSRPWYDKNNF